MKSGWLFLALYSLTVIFRLWYFSKRGWRSPLKNGERYFLEVEVPEGWHSSAEGKRWWRRYWAAIVIPHLMEAVAFVAIAIWGDWSQLPLLSFVAPVFVVFITGFVLWWRRASGADRNKPRRIAVPLRQRRLGEYFSWRAEALMLVLLLSSWVLIAVRGDAEVRWRMPVTFTYVIAWLALVKVGVVKQSWALPVERTPEYEHWQNLRRKQAARVLDAMRWMLVIVVIGYSTLHGMGGIVPLQPVRWGFITLAVAQWVWMMLAFARGERALDRAGAGLPPAAMAIDWRKGWWSFGGFLAGLAVLLFWPWG